MSNKLGENIKKYRKKKGLTQKQLGESIGLSTVAIKNYENNQREPKLDIIDKIATALGIKRLDLLEENIVKDIKKDIELYKLETFDSSGKQIYCLMTKDYKDIIDIITKKEV